METISVSLNNYIWRKWGGTIAVFLFFGFFGGVNHNDFEVFNITEGLAVRFSFLFMLQCAMSFRTKRDKRFQTKNK